MAALDEMVVDPICSVGDLLCNSLTAALPSKAAVQVLDIHLLQSGCQASESDGLTSGLPYRVVQGAADTSAAKPSIYIARPALLKCTCRRYSPVVIEYAR